MISLSEQEDKSNEFMGKTVIFNIQEAFHLINFQLPSIFSNLLSCNFLRDDFSPFTVQSYSKGRESILNMSKFRDSYGYINRRIVEEPSSDEESEGEDKETNEDLITSRSLKNPSVKEVCESIFDVSIFKTIESITDFPEGCKPGILFEKLDDDMTAEDLKQYIEHLQVLKIEKNLNTDVEEVIMFTITDVYYGLVKFSNTKICEKIHSFFNNPVKVSYPCHNRKKETIKISYGYDISDLKYSNWYAVVLRNLPTIRSREEILMYCRILNNDVKYAVTPKMVGKQICSIVVLRSLDSAEELCWELTTKTQIKGNIHLKSCKLRQYPEKSHFSNLFKNTLDLENISYTQENEKEKSICSAKFSQHSEKITSPSNQKTPDTIVMTVPNLNKPKIPVKKKTHMKAPVINPNSNITVTTEQKEVPSNRICSLTLPGKNLSVNNEINPLASLLIQQGGDTRKEKNEKIKNIRSCITLTSAKKEVHSDTIKKEILLSPKYIQKKRDRPMESTSPGNVQIEIIQQNK